MRILTDISEAKLTVNPIYTKEKKSTLSDRYKVVETDKIIEVFQENGLQVIGKSFAGTRKKENEGFQKHMVIFSNDNLITDEGQLQLLLTNSHNGTSSYQLDLGFYRTVCANGLISGNTESSIKIRHTVNCLDKVDQAIKYQLERLPLIAAKIDSMRQVELTPEQVHDLHFKAALLRSHSGVEKVFEVLPSRLADTPNNLWTIFNRVQEKLIQGGFTYINNEGLLKRTRKITGINSVTKINKELWNIADDILKAA